MTSPAGAKAPPTPDTVPDAPAVDGLKPPLSATDRDEIYAYFAYQSKHGWKNVQTRAQLEKLSDAQLIFQYTALVKTAGAAGSAGGVVTGAITSVTDFLNKLWSTLTSANLWLRVLEVGIGVVLLAVGVAHLSGHANPIAKHAGVKL